MEYYADIKKNKTIIFRETHGTVDHCVKWNKPESDTQICHVSLMRNLDFF
jgi:hypothetical protein